MNWGFVQPALLPLASGKPPPSRASGKWPLLPASGALPPPPASGSFVMTVADPQLIEEAEPSANNKVAPDTMVLLIGTPSRRLRDPHARGMPGCRPPVKERSIRRPVRPQGDPTPPVGLQSPPAGG